MSLAPTLRSLSNDLEPLVPESRLAAIEARLRTEHPLLPDNAVFLTHLQPAQEIEADVNGILRPVPIAPIACFSIFVPHPKYPERKGYGYLATGRMFMYQRDANATRVRAWQTLEQEHRHSTEIETDPAYIALKVGPMKEALSWYDSIKDLIVKPRKAEILDGASR